MPTVGTIIRTRREELGLNAQALADRVGTTATQVSRWENGRQEPTASNIIALTRALALSADELLGLVPIGLRLSGTWFAGHDTSRDGVPVIDRHTLIGELRGVDFTFAATGDYLWSGSLRYNDTALEGAYLSTEADKVYHGTLCLWLSEDATAAIGRWVGRWADGKMGEGGWTVFARDEDRVAPLMDILMTHEGPLTEWPKEDARWTPPAPTEPYLPAGALRAVG